MRSIASGGGWARTRILPSSYAHAYKICWLKNIIMAALKLIVQLSVFCNYCQMLEHGGL